MESIPGVTYFVSKPHDTLCWLKKPVTIKKEYKYKGEVRSKQVVEMTEKAPIFFETIAKNLNNYFWHRRKVSEGTKGPIEYEFTKRRVILSKNGFPEKEVWLIIRRTLDEKPSYSYYTGNAL